MKPLFFSLVVVLAALTAEAKEYKLNFRNKTLFDGSTIDLIARIERMDTRFDADEYKILEVDVLARSLGRNNPSGVYLSVKGRGACLGDRGSNEVKLRPGRYTTATIANPNNRNISDGAWYIGACGRIELDAITVYLERRRQGGGGSSGNNGGGGRPPRNPKLYVSAGYTPQTTIEEVDERAHTVVIRNLVNNRSKIQIDEIYIMIATRGGRDHKWLDLQNYHGEYLKPGQELAIPMPQNRNGNDVRRVLEVEVKLESWEFGGEDVEIEFISGLRRRRGNNGRPDRPGRRLH